MILLTSLIAAGVAPTQAREFAEPLNAACDRFGIDTKARIAAFLGQCMVESNAFTALEENLFYTRPERIQFVFSSRVPDLQKASTLVRNPRALANCVYAGKNGNGNEASGDGWRYRGRGVFQMTGRANYHNVSTALGIDYVALPDLVGRPVDACLTAASFWKANNLNFHADSWLLDEITRGVNGKAMMHADLRRQYSEQALKALS